MSRTFFLSFIFCLVCSSAYSFNLSVSFPQGTLDIDFAYSISTGECSNPNSMKCKVTQARISLGSAYVTKYLQSINNLFKALIPVEDKIHKPSNYVTIQATGKKEGCVIDILGKKSIAVVMTKDGVCVVK